MACDARRILAPVGLSVSSGGLRSVLRGMAAAAALSCLVVPPACDGSSLSSGLPDGTVDCGECHGTLGNSAPPASLTGQTLTGDPAVGVHQAHLSGGKVRTAVLCSECHVVPSKVDDPGHLNGGPAEITFGLLATAGGVKPSFDPVLGKCFNTYCHGGSLAGGRLTAPAWRTGCDACHGNPPEMGGDPPKAHPRDTDCSKCHSAYADANGLVAFEGSKHPSPAGCDACHGFPPPSPHPQSPSCRLCHSGTVAQDGTIALEGGLHIDGSVQAAANGPHLEGYASPAEHGQDFLAGGTAACSSCHGAGLDGGISGTSCEKCHPGFRKSCTFCHGGTDNQTGAPPESISGGTATALTGVGAHSAHLSSSDWHAAISCSDCHAVPTDALSPAHMSGKAEVEFGVLATGEEGQPVFNGTSCSAVYCHGGRLSGGTQVQPNWTQVDGTQAACGTCHGLPPTEDHPKMSDCSMCHGCVAGPDGQIRAEGAPYHINGEVNMQGKDSCPED